MDLRRGLLVRKDEGLGRGAPHTNKGCEASPLALYLSVSRGEARREIPWDGTARYGHGLSGVVSYLGIPMVDLDLSPAQDAEDSGYVGPK